MTIHLQKYLHEYGELLESVGHHSACRICHIAMPYIYLKTVTTYLGMRLHCRRQPKMI